MNNLLRTLTEIQTKSALPDPDLRLLLSTVKDARRQTLDTKASDAFYDSLEGLLLDLRTVTLDNRDAEAFLKPVSKTDVPDYYDVITTPMDLQTMLKKVKQKSYKSKREFKDDLDLIWSNCFTYNATENHPLRQCASRLKAKAERLLKYVTDRKERADPLIPGDISRGVTPRPNGIPLNGMSRPYPSPLPKSPSPGKAIPVSETRRDVQFPDTPAILRSASGMVTFYQLDYELTAQIDTDTQMMNGTGNSEWEQKLKDYTLGSQDDDDEFSLRTYDGEVGEKRKMNGHSYDNRPRKRARMQYSESQSHEPIDVWWNSMKSDVMIANGLPTITYASSEPSLPHQSQPSIPSPRKKRKKKQTKPQPSNTLLYYMNNNIKTLRKIRTTHAKFAALSMNNDDNGGAGAGAGVGGGPGPPAELPPPPLDEVEEVLDERPWRTSGSGLEIGEENAGDCLHWMTTKVLEHVGFQGGSKAALDVLTGVASDYLLNVGRTICFLSEKFANQMSPEEIILHTLFESGTTRVLEMDRYVKDDIVRYGARLSDLEKKLANAYSEATTEEAWDDDALFKQEDEEEEGEFVMGNFADSLGDDFLGLRELGIADEFGLSSLTVPKRLLKGKSKGDLKPGVNPAKPAEPPLPFPPPPPFIPLDSNRIENQIGLLKPYYLQRVATLAPATSVAPPVPPPGFPPYASMDVDPPPNTTVPPVISLPDDAPTSAQSKLGPIGQVMKPASSAAKKKAVKPKAPIAPAAIGAALSLNGDGPFDGLAAPETPASVTHSLRGESESPKKPKPGLVNGSNTGKKKAAKTTESGVVMSGS